MAAPDAILRADDARKEKRDDKFENKPKLLRDTAIVLLNTFNTALP